MGRERLEIEFGLYSEWLAEAVHALGIDPVGAGCRGTGNPELFESLADRIGAGPGTRVLDLGCGIGGPGGWLTQNRHCETIGVDVMERGVRGLRRLFPEARAVVASLRALPLGDETFDAAWALGVIETINDKDAALGEVVRVLKPEARLGIYGYVAERLDVPDSPAADRFEDSKALIERLTKVGFAIEAAELADDLGRVPSEWRALAQQARDEVGRRHAQDTRMDDFERESEKISRLIQTKAIEPWIFVARKEAI